MATTEGDKTVVLKFGGGVHSRASEEDIDVRECSKGENFDLDLQNFHLRRRKAFSTLGQVPNGSEIRGFISLKDSNGNISFLVQAGDTVYQWDGTTFTSRATVNASAKLRGRISHNWLLDDIVIITDINLSDVVMQWDGTTLSDIAFTDENDASYTPFQAKYCIIRDERAIYGNVIDKVPFASPHMMVGSKVSDYKNITVANQPSSALAEDDPFYLLTPDLRQINSEVSAFGLVTLSTVDGNVWKLIGNSSKDFQFNELYPDSAASGDESMTYIGNDILYGRPGIIESLARTDKFADVATDDISVGISDSIDGYTDWTLVYNKRTQRVYCYSNSTSEFWVLYKPLIQTNISYWIKMTTLHSVNMDPTAMMNAYDPVTGLEEIYFGDSSGNVYQIDGGDDTSGDGGLNAIRMTRTSKMIAIPENAQNIALEGWLKYRKQEDVEVTLKVIFQGEQIYTHEITINLTKPEGSYFGGTNYFGGNFYFGSEENKLFREIFAIPGKSNEFQIEVIIDDKNTFSISEIGFQFNIS